MEIPENRRIQDLESWLQVNALLPSTNGCTNDSSNDKQEEQSIWDERHEYQKQIHQSIFQEYDTNELQKIHEKQLFLNQWDDTTSMIQIITSNTSNNLKEDVNDIDDTNNNNNSSTSETKTTTTTLTTTTIIEVPVRKLCETCDVLFTYVQSLDMYSNNNNNNNNNDVDTSNDINCTESESKLTTIPTLLQFSLLEYTTVSVQEFLNIIVYKTKTIYDYTTDNNEYILVDICRIAHYLQCNNNIIDDITKNIFLPSIDTTNCLFFVQLADELNISILFEHSIQLLLNSITKLEKQNDENIQRKNTVDTMSDTDMMTTTNNETTMYTKVVLSSSSSSSNNNNNNNINDTIVVSSELYERIIQIKTAIQSSIHNQRSEIYVSTIHEYIAIFAEQVQYYTERLQDAIDNFNSLQSKQEQQQNDTNTNTNDTNTARYYNDIQTKIYNQQQRVQTLQIVLQEQKKLFLNSHNKFMY